MKLGRLTAFMVILAAILLFGGMIYTAMVVDEENERAKAALSSNGEQLKVEDAKAFDKDGVIEIRIYVKRK